MIVAGGRGLRDALSTRLVAAHAFAGYWEYHLETALFTAPAHPRGGGAACTTTLAWPVVVPPRPSETT